MKYAVLWLLLCVLILPGQSVRADEQLGNRRESVVPVTPAAPRVYLAPGAVVRLPDGRRSRVAVRLPDGTYRTEDGVVIAQDGRVLEGAAQGAVVLLEPSSDAGATVPQENAVVPQENVTVAPQENVTVAPQENITVTPRTADEGQARPGVETPAPHAPVAVPQAQGPGAPDVTVAPATPSSPQGEQHLTLAELLPLTPIPGTARRQEQAKPEKPKAEQAKPEKPKAEQAKPEKPKAEQAKPEKPRPRPEPARKPKVGEELRIPPDAAKTGNLDFLEGCWQGTRPEYYSKRIIRECFCFGAHGGNGKRRVLDDIGGRTCIGATRARLSKAGVLSVTSEGAACSDGERWGQAEMVCRGKGQKTPCSWVFKDANGGRQAYEIPFVRVESCRRR